MTSGVRARGRQAACRCSRCRAGVPCAASLAVADQVVSDPDPQRRLVARALATLAGGIPAMITGWYPVNLRGENAGGSIALGAASTGVPLQTVRAEYVARYHRDDPFAPARYLDRATRLASVAEVGGSEALARTDYARELLPELGAAHQAALYLRDGGRMLGYVSVLRNAEQGEFSDRELAFMRRFQPFFELAYCSGLRTAPPLERDHLLSGNGLTSREQETAQLAASGSTNPQIAAALMVSEATVKTHLHRVYRKLEVRNRTELCLLLGSSSDRPL